MLGLQVVGHAPGPAPLPAGGRASGPKVRRGSLDSLGEGGVASSSSSEEEEGGAQRWVKLVTQLYMCIEGGRKLKFAPFCSSWRALSNDMLFCQNFKYQVLAKNHGLYSGVLIRFLSALTTPDWKVLGS